MTDNAEEGIARAQAEAVKAQGTQGDALRKYQERSIAYLDERVLIFLFAIAIVGLVIVWAVAKSTLVVYGSFFVALVLIILAGIARIKRIQRIRQKREQQAREWGSSSSD